MLYPECFNGFGTGTTPGNACSLYKSGKVRIFGQKAVSGNDGVGASLLCNFDNVLAISVDGGIATCQ